MTIAQDYNFNHCIMKKIIYGLAIAGIAVSMTSCAQKQNTLTSAEKADGWVLLFNGENLDGWRDYNGDSLTNGWTQESSLRSANAPHDRCQRQSLSCSIHLED